MNKVCSIIIFLAIAGCIMSCLVGCQKDYSIEGINGQDTLLLFPVINTPAAGSLKDGFGNCQTITVNGSYTQDTALTNENSITVTVNFTVTGKYKIYTDTVNGCWFTMDTATTYNTGIKTVTLNGYGTPTVAGTSDFNVYFLNSSCPFSVDVNHLSATDRDYFPMTVGTHWTDRTDSVINGAFLDTIRYTVTNHTAVLNNSINNTNYTYTLFTSSKKDSNYYRKDYRGHYYQYTTLFTSYGIPGFELEFLDDTQPVGTVFSQIARTGTATNNGVTQAVTINISCEIMEKNIQYQLFGTQSIDSVIHVQQSISIVFSSLNGDPPTSLNLVPNDVYYAKKIGLITYNSTSSAPSVYLIGKNWYIY